jgi:hypothetical protein
MDYNIVLICAVFIGALALIINSFRNKAVRKIIEENKDVPQLFLQRTVDNKLHTLQHALRQTVTGNLSDDPQLAKINNLRLALSAELDELTNNYRGKKITLKAYDHKLDAILQKLKQDVIY